MVAPEDFIKVADKGNEFLNSSIVNHQRRLTEAINQLEKNIIDQVKEFKTTNGTLLGPRINMKQAQKIHGQLNSMFAETYGKEARAVSTGFNKAAKYIQNELGELDLAAVFTSVDKDMIDTLKKSSWGTFNKFGLTAQEQMTDQMYNAIIGKAPFSTLVTNFQGILSGHKDARGRPMTTYANLYANDAIMNFHNSVHMKKAEDAGIKYFMYYGNLMTTSRDFCIQRIGKVYSKEVIDSWDYNWGGKSGPAFTNRGGYNCRHRWVAVRKNWLDDSVEVIDDVEVPKAMEVTPVEPSISRTERVNEAMVKVNKQPRIDILGDPDPDGMFNAGFYEQFDFAEGELKAVASKFRTAGKLDLEKINEYSVTKEININPKNLKGKQPFITPEKMEYPLNNPDPANQPIVLRYKGEDIIWDGHHRITADYLMGIEKRAVRYIDYDALFGVPEEFAITKAEKELAEKAVWKSAKTLEEAEERFKSVGINSVTKGNEKLVREEWLKTSVSPMLKEMERIKIKFPEIFNLIDKSDNPIKVLEIWRGSSFPGDKTVYGMYSENKKHIRLMVPHPNSKIRKMEHLLTVGEGNFSISSDPMSSLRHEFGHYLQETVLMKDSFKDKVWRKIAERENVYDYFEKYVSKYASSNVQEAFAESFAAYTSPKYQTGMLPKEIEKYFDDLFK